MRPHPLIVAAAIIPGTLAAIIGLPLAAHGLTVDDQGDRPAAIRAPLCPAEDSCRVDYSRRGWRLQECAQACDDDAPRGPWRRVLIRG